MENTTEKLPEDENAAASLEQSAVDALYDLRGILDDMLQKTDALIDGAGSDDRRDALIKQAEKADKKLAEIEQMFEKMQ